MEIAVGINVFWYLIARNRDPEGRVSKRGERMCTDFDSLVKGSRLKDIPKGVLAGYEDIYEDDKDDVDDDDDDAT